MQTTSHRSTSHAMLHRLTGPLTSLLNGGTVRYGEDGIIELLITAHEAVAGGMATISLPVAVQRRDGNVEEELFSAWLTIPENVADGTLLTPSVALEGMVDPVEFRVRVAAVAES